jgi:hypothetical protein
MATPDKDTIYIDIDDEITGVIDKVKNAKTSVVALVLPKRASVFQSIVNMKLLKRAADESKKNLVLITAEAGLLPLAGVAGIHVAKTLTAKPAIPLSPTVFNDSDEAVGEDEAMTTPVTPTDELDPTKPISQLTGDEPAKLSKDSVETVTLDNSQDEPEDEAESAEDKDDKTSKKNKALKVPNFNRFRLIGTLVVVALLVLIIGFIVANAELQKATIDISTNSTNVNTNLNLNLSTTASTVDPNGDVIPAKYQQENKTYTQTVGTTGQKNEGNQASGSITVSAGSCGSNSSLPSNIPAGTGVSANSLTYIIQDEIEFVYQPNAGGRQCNVEGVDATNPNNGDNIPITAQSGGSSYNVSGVPFTIADYSSYSASGSASGGTDNFVQTVNQNDIDNAKSKIGSGNSSAIKQALINQLNSEGYFPISATFTTSSPNITSSANVGAPASSVTVTETINYSMFGVYESDLNSLIDTTVDGQINTAQQSILSTGLNNANFSVVNLSSSGGQVAISTTAIAGPQLNITTIKKNAAGKRAGDIRSQIMNNPNVTNVSVSFSPFWVNSAPSNTSKITVKIAKPTTTKST